MKPSTIDCSVEASKPAPLDRSWKAGLILSTIFGLRREGFRKYYGGPKFCEARRRLLRKIRRQWNDQKG